MVYIVSTLLRKAFETPDFIKYIENAKSLNELWTALMLEP
jgi:hypothetical protein